MMHFAPLGGYDALCTTRGIWCTLHHQGGYDALCTTRGGYDALCTTKGDMMHFAPPGGLWCTLHHQGGIWYTLHHQGGYDALCTTRGEKGRNINNLKLHWMCILKWHLAQASKEFQKIKLVNLKMCTSALEGYQSFFNFLKIWRKKYIFCKIFFRMNS